jgi:hypothetical protein
MKGSKQLKKIASKAIPSEAEVNASYPPPKVKVGLKWKRDMDDLPGHVRRAERES